MLSRVTADIRNKTLIINLSGSPKTVRESLEYIIDSLQHGLEILENVQSDRKEGFLEILKNVVSNIY